ncbi:hypothetical protein Moror_641 [Moniliophthora roreri MCA 2997]|uniref:Uncharacterized protein n=1 Tax=Moniliophthora roreri (strain MCA 2997) TaxID=1381753 RepID=V2XZ76_MONRO|nr:hypothetical protein Moror_641 [Moniliophthora roreri MCA 2997]
MSSYNLRSRGRGVVVPASGTAASSPRRHSYSVPVQDSRNSSMSLTLEDTEELVVQPSDMLVGASGDGDHMLGHLAQDLQGSAPGVPEQSATDKLRDPEVEYIQACFAVDLRDDQNSDIKVENVLTVKTQDKGKCRDYTGAWPDANLDLAELDVNIQHSILEKYSKLQENVTMSEFDEFLQWKKAHQHTGAQKPSMNNQAVTIEEVTDEEAPPMRCASPRPGISSRTMSWDLNSKDLAVWHASYAPVSDSMANICPVSKGVSDNMINCQHTM